MIGEVVDGKYQVLRQLGLGGMGAVYEAIHLGTHRRVALKVILGSDASKKPDVVIRFQREAKAAGAIDTQHIVQVLDTGIDPARGAPYMVMELLAGEDVKQLLGRVGPLPSDVALRIVAQCCIGLDKAHEAGVVHRDIKSANIFLARRDGNVVVKLLDFGIAKVKVDELTDSESKGLTRTGSLLGSPLYMSPEQAMGLKTIDHRSDVWSLGAVLYETLGGRTPHGNIETLGQLIFWICSQPPTPLQELAPWVTPEIAAIVHRCLVIDPNARIPTARALLDALRPHLPRGWDLTEAAIVPLTDAERAVVAPALALSAPESRASLPSGVDLPPPGSASLVSSSPILEASLGASADHIPSQTHPGLWTSGSRSSSSRVAPIATGAAVVAIAMAVGGWLLLRHPTVPEAPRVSGDVSPPATASAPAQAPPAATPAEPVVAASSVAATRSVRLAVVPPNAKVEVDGEPTEVQDGTVGVSGAPGSVHSVRLTLGARETKAEVVVTDTGVLPSKIELGTKVASVPVQRPASGPAGPASAGPKVPPRAAGTSKTETPRAPGIDKTFE